jgi:catalase
VEQGAFSPANVVPGIGFSPDKMLQGRLFSYGYIQRYRLGVNFNHIPVNAPKCPLDSYHRDGKMRTDGNLVATTADARTARDCGTTNRNAMSSRSRSKATLVTMPTA